MKPALHIRPATAADVSRLMGQLGYDVAPDLAAARLSRVLARIAERFGR
jgi:hypothetical protein